MFNFISILLLQNFQNQIKPVAFTQIDAINKFPMSLLEHSSQIDVRTAHLLHLIIHLLLVSLSLSSLSFSPYKAQQCKAITNHFN